MRFLKIIKYLVVIFFYIIVLIIIFWLLLTFFTEMPKNLSNRLEKLENDLQMLLMLQRVSSRTEHKLTKTSSMQSTSTGTSDGHSKQRNKSHHCSVSCMNDHGSQRQENDQLSFKEYGDTKSNCLQDEKSSGFKLMQPADKILNFEAAQTNKEQMTDHVKRVNFTYPTEELSFETRERYKQMKDATTKCEDRNQKFKQLSNNAQNNLPATKTGDKRLKEKYELSLKELEAQQNKCIKLEQTMDKQRVVLENNRVAIEDMISSKKMALEMAKQLREKYENMRMSRRDAMMELGKIKSESNNLSSQLEQEVEARKNLNMQLETLKGDIESSKSYKQETEKKLISMQQDNEKLKRKTAELENKARETEKLLQNKEEEFKVEFKKRYSEAETEFKKIKTMMEEKEILLLTEHEELKLVMQELNDLVNQNKNRIAQLTEINKEQEDLIQSQTEIISNKEQELQIANEQLKAMTRKIADLENQVELFRRSVEMHDQLKKDWTLQSSKYEEVYKEYMSKTEALERDLKHYRCMLDAEKDKLLIKDKIIEDQNSSIKQMKISLNEKTEELRKLSREREEIEKELTQEKLQNQKSSSKMKQLEWQKKQLVEQVAELEEELTNVEKGPALDNEKHQQMLLKLEKQVESKQIEWSLQFKLLNNQKEQALKAARYATHKFVETTREFQRHVSTQKKIQHMLASLLSEKDAQLKLSGQQIVSLNQLLEFNLKKTQCMQHDIQAKLVKAQDAFSEVIQNVNLKEKK